MTKRDPDRNRRDVLYVQERKRTKEGWLRYALTHAKHRAKKKGLEFDVKPSDIVVPDVCPVLGIPLQVNVGNNARKNGNSPSLDRIKNERGYVKGNVRVISARANHLKSNATREEIEAVYLDLAATTEHARGFAHVNQHHIKANAADGGNRPVLTVKKGGVTRYAREARFAGPTRLRYDGSSLSCGARCWIEFDGPVELIDEMTFAESRQAA